MTEPYALDPEPAAPDLPGPVTVRPTLEDVIDPLAADLYLHALTCVRTFGDFHIAFSVGDPQLRVAMRLMVDPAYRELPWPRTHLWMVHDAAVPLDHDESLMGELFQIVGEHAGMPRSHIHGVPHSGEPAEQYERELQQTLAWRERGQDRLDYVLLALSDSGGLLGTPESGLPESGDRLVAPVNGTGPAGAAMTTRLLSATRLIAFLAAGEGPRPTLDRIAAGDHAPIGGIRPVGGAMRWYLDKASAGPARPEINP